MYSEHDIEKAVRDGAISAEAASALRTNVAVAHQSPAVDEEHFRLITGFNDIFVTVAVLITLFAVGMIGQQLFGNADGPSYIAAALIAASAWGLAEYFTRQRRMALPSIVLTIAFGFATFTVFAGIAFAIFGDILNGEEDIPLALSIFGVCGLLTAIAMWFHWKRFMVPITVAAGASALAATVIGLATSGLVAANIVDEDNAGTAILTLVFIAGIAIFYAAMRWDISDQTRQTRRSDVAFWLHLASAPMIAHPLFSLLGVTDGSEIGAGGALLVIAVYLAFGFVALAIDRRALLVSALAYVLFALSQLFKTFGAVELNVALTALVIGSALLLLSAFWTNARAKVLHVLPETLTARLPVLGRTVPLTAAA